MRSMLGSGFIFWGLFLVFGLILAGYLLWMHLAEKDEQNPGLPPPPGDP